LRPPICLRPWLACMEPSVSRSCLDGCAWTRDATLGHASGRMRLYRAVRINCVGPDCALTIVPSVDLASATQSQQRRGHPTKSSPMCLSCHSRADRILHVFNGRVSAEIPSTAGHFEVTSALFLFCLCLPNFLVMSKVAERAGLTTSNLPSQANTSSTRRL